MNAPVANVFPPELAVLGANLEAARVALKKERSRRVAAERALKAASATERQRFAQAMHDTLAQSLTAIYFMAMGMEKELENSGSDASRKVGELGKLIRRASNELHTYIRGQDVDPPPSAGAV